MKINIKSNYYFIILLIISFFLLLINAKNSQSLSDKFSKRIANRETAPIYKDWNNYPDIKNLDKYQKIAKLSVSWDGIDAKDRGSTIIGLKWDRTSKEYPFLTKTLTNLEEAKKTYDLIHSYNPNIMLGVEIRWDAIKDYELPPDHKWWKRDSSGNRIKYGQPKPPRYETNVYDPTYISWVGERCKAMLDTGVVDFIFLDHIKYFQDHGGDPVPFLKGLREKVGPDAIIIGNTHFVKMPEIAKYIDAWGEEQSNVNYLDVISFWENNGRKAPNFNCWEFIGPKNDYKAMRYYTTLVMTNTNASLRYIDHSGSTSPSVWYDFWDVKIGKIKGDKTVNGKCFAREYTNGTTICNNTFGRQNVIFNEVRMRASTGEKSKEFIIQGKDGDFFLFVK